MAETQSLRFDLAISGAGFAGLALAHALSTALGPDFRMALVDRRSLAAADDPSLWSPLVCVRVKLARRSISRNARRFAA